ncbi:MAG TPA: FemAB family XrtA/PEP-CTERM system-associated protein [Gemmatimonadales bacterium]|nr:FemAB family XrtA/PEP-CTERM system-associated protein [Gemmatimonadales bacterium]
MTLTVARHAGDGADWDACVRSSAGGTHYHLWAWRGVLQRVFKHDCPYLAAHDEQGRLRGVLPLVRVKSLVFGHYLVSMPYLNYGGPLGTPDAVRALAAAAADLARSDGAKLLELRSAIPLDVDLPVSHRKITVLLELPEGDAAPLWDGLKAKVRSQVRRPMKEGVTVAFGRDQIDGFYHVFAHHMRDLGTPVQPRALFERIEAAFGENVWFGCARLDGRPIAVGCGFHWGDEFEMTWASALASYNRIAPNMLLYWEFMARCVREGVRTFNFGRCTPGGTTHRFKRQWGGRDVPLWWYQWSRDATAGTPSPDDGAYALGPRLWRHLPVSVATALGPRIVRGIP